MYRNRSRLALGLFLTLAASPAAHAQCPDQSFRGLDTGSSDGFGASLATSFPRLIVGAPKDDDQGALAGSAYIFLAGPGGFVQEQKIYGSGVDAGDSFGHAVAMTNLGAFVSAPNDDGFGQDTGTVYGYLRNGTFWTQVTRLDPGEGDAGDRFGWSVAVSGTLAVVGAPDAESEAGGTHGGAAYVFEAGGGNGWQFVTKLVPNDINGDPDYGHSVAIDGERIVVGAPKDNDGGFNAGAAYVFDRVGGNWFLSIKLIAIDFQPNDAFGWAVDVDGDEVIVGSPIATGNGARSGAAYVFSDGGGPWTQDAKLFDPGGAAVDRLGFSVSIDGGHAMAGAPFAQVGGQTVGRAYELGRPNGTWMLLSSVLSPSGTALSRVFGAAVAVAGTLRAVGDSADFENVVHAFVLDGPDCNANGLPDDCDIANGTSNDNNNNGIPDECDGCDLDNYCTSGPNSTGAPAVISATGSLGISANDFVLHAAPVPNQPGLFFFGPSDDFAPFGNGFRCVAGPISRLPITVASGNVMTTALDQTLPPALGQIAPFSTWYFQCWYRDPAAGGASFDLTDGLKVTFCP